MIIDEMYNIDNLSMNDLDYTKYMNDSLDSITINLFDPEVGQEIQVNSIESDSSGKKLYAIIEGDYKIELNYSFEKDWIQDYLFSKFDIEDTSAELNKKQVFSLINNSQEVLKKYFKENQVNVIILENSSNRVQGSISYVHRNAVYEIFNKCLSSNSKEVFSCKIISRNSGGYYGLINSVLVFIPGSLAHHKKIENYDELLNTTIKVCIENYSREKNIYIFSHVKYLKNILPEIIASLDKSNVYEARVTGLSSFGLFLSCNSMLNGLLHVTEMKEDLLEKFTSGQIFENDIVHVYFKQYIDDKLILSQNSYKDNLEAWNKNVEIYKNTVQKLEVVKKVKSGYLLEMPNKRTRAMLYDVEAMKYKYPIAIGQFYNVLIDRTDFENNKIYLSCPDDERK